MMRALSSAASISIHAVIAAAFLLGTTKPAHPNSIEAEALPLPLVFPELTKRAGEVGTDLSIPVVTIPRVPVDLIVSPATLPQSEAFTRPVTPTASGPATRLGSGAAAGLSSVTETGPEVLAGPLPAYPDLLRQAGIEGQVVLEARVDTTGRVLRGSVVVVSATHPGFVEPARRALVATLFRPARVDGRAVPMLVRVPFAFSLRGGTGHAR